MTITAKHIIIGLIAAAAAYGTATIVSEPKIRTVDYYKEHTQARDRKISECQNSPGTAQNDPNCINALAARAQSMFNDLIPPSHQ